MNAFYRDVFESKDAKEKFSLVICSFWFKKRVIESEKRQIWRKISEARQTGKTLDASIYSVEKINWDNKSPEDNEH